MFTLVFSGLVECGSVVGFEDSAGTPNPKFWQVHFPLEWDGCVNLRDWTGGGPRSCIQAVFRMGTWAPLGQDTESLAAGVNELMAVTPGDGDHDSETAKQAQIGAGLWSFRFGPDSPPP